MSKRAPSIYESFNARTLSNDALCETFIVSEHFRNLASPNHTIVVGPRGSGKTTLMRMLQVETLKIWEDQESEEFRKKISFSGVFIPTDRLWKNQSDKLSDSNIITAHEAKSLVIASFTYHILERLTQTLISRTKSGDESFKSISLNKSNEAQLTLELAKTWKVKPNISSLLSLSSAITQKKKEISDYISCVLSNTVKTHSHPERVEGDITSTIGASITLINNYINEADGKWCFLFDELELAPEEIIQPLVDSMRGGPENIILKLSLSPYHRELIVTNSPLSSMKNQDISFICLTGSSVQDGLEFSRKLCGNIFAKNGLEKDIEEYFEQPKELSEEAVFSELASKDPDFKAYLHKNKIEIGKIKLYTEEDKRPTIRKVKFIANLRNYYLKANKRASRKQAPSYYAGFNEICKALEYNPRMLIGVMNKISQKASNERKITISAQLTALSEMNNSYQDLLQTIAIDSQGNELRSIYDLVEAIGKELSKDISGEKFTAEPKGVITFRTKISGNYVEAIGFALNSGALIIENDKDESLFNKNKMSTAECRLSYLFSHKFGILTNKGRKVELGRLLGAEQKIANYLRPVDPLLTPPQMDLL